VKVNIISSNEQILNQYLNLCINGYDNRESVVNINDIELSEIVDLGEATEIRAINILEQYPGTMSDKIVKSWVEKLSRKGQITIGFTDIIEVSKGLISRILSIDDANDLIHGRQNEPWEFKQSSFHVNQLAEFLKSLNLKILLKRVVKYRGIIIGERQ
jgi:hypothetical protein